MTFQFGTLPTLRCCPQNNQFLHIKLVSLFTGVLLDAACANLALHLTAPLEFAVAALLYDDLFRVVSTAAT